MTKTPWLNGQFLCFYILNKSENAKSDLSSNFLCFVEPDKLVTKNASLKLNANVGQ